MTSLLKELYKNWRYFFDEVVEQGLNEFLFMDSIFYPIAIIAIYLYFVHRAGPRFMKNRPAYKIDKIVAFYNFTQVVISLYLFHLGFYLGWGTKTKFICATIDRSDPVLHHFILSNGWKYFIVKIVDLLDTVFFILRKNHKQVTFLHIYHHAGMVLSSWMFLKMYPGGDAIWIPFLNTFVHAAMYSYYLVTSMWPDYKKNIWWKKHITHLQMAQFLILGLHSIPAIFMKDCTYPLGASIFIVIQSIVMFFLFFNFYIHAYYRKKKSA